MAGKAVAKKETGGLPAELLKELEADGQEFRETLTQDEKAMPFFQILQSLSPQCVEGDPAYIEGARPGMFFNTITGEIMDGKEKGFRMVSIAFKPSYIEWVPRSKGGGFVNEYDVAEGSAARTMRNDQNLDIIQAGSPVGTPGNQLNYTHTHFVMILTDEGPVPAILTMTSTQVKPSKSLNYMIDNLKIPGTLKPAPRFFGIWQVNTEMKKNDQGSWYIFKFSGDGTLNLADDLEAAIYKGARDFAASVKSGETQADHSKAAGDNPPVGDDDSAGEDGDDDIPF